MTDNLPKSIRVGANDYELNRVRGLSAGETLWGQIVYGTNRINIEDSLEGSRVRDVIAHELAHAILYEAGYDDHEEEQANRIGKVLAMLLRDNDFGFMCDKEDDE